MGIRFMSDIDIVSKLKSAGYSTYKIRKEHIFGESIMTRFRNGDPVSLDSLAQLCLLLNCQPSDLIEYIPDSPAPKDDTNDSQ